MTAENSGSGAPGGLEALLGAYAAGGLAVPLHALVASHLTLCARNRAFVEALEHLGAADMTAGEGLPASDRETRLAAIFARGAESAAPLRADANAVFPAPLRGLVGFDAEDTPWRFVLPGIREYRIPATGAGEAKLYRISAGKRLPAHTHEGSEITLVLRGAFSDSTGHFARGDIAIADAELDHHPVADAGGDCICFAVTDAPLHLTGPVGRWINPLLRSRH